MTTLALKEQPTTAPSGTTGHKPATTDGSFHVREGDQVQVTWVQPHPGEFWAYVIVGPAAYDLKEDPDLADQMCSLWHGASAAVHLVLQTQRDHYQAFTHTGADAKCLREHLREFTNTILRYVDDSSCRLQRDLAGPAPSPTASATAVAGTTDE